MYLKGMCEYPSQGLVWSTAAALPTVSLQQTCFCQDRQCAPSGPSVLSQLGKLNQLTALQLGKIRVEKCESLLQDTSSSLGLGW